MRRFRSYKNSGITPQPVEAVIPNFWSVGFCAPIPTPLPVCSPPQSFLQAGSPINQFLYLFSVPFRHEERIGFSYLISQKYTGDYALVRVLRNSKILEFNKKTLM